MKKIVINDNLEDIFKVPNDISCIEISQIIIIRYLLNNRDEGQINTEELRELFNESIRLSYSKRSYLDNVSVNRAELQKLNSSCTV